MHFILDECIPSSGLEALRSAGFRAEMITEHIAPKSPDQFVASVADSLGAIIVSHDRDFKRIISRRPDGQLKRFRDAHLIKMECKHARIGGRLLACMPILETEFTSRATMKDRRLIVWISGDMVKVWR